MHYGGETMAGRELVGAAAHREREIEEWQKGIEYRRQNVISTR